MVATRLSPVRAEGDKVVELEIRGSLGEHGAGEVLEVGLISAETDTGDFEPAGGAERLNGDVAGPRDAAAGVAFGVKGVGCLGVGSGGEFSWRFRSTAVSCGRAIDGCGLRARRIRW